MPVHFLGSCIVYPFDVAAAYPRLQAGVGGPAALLTWYTFCGILSSMKEQNTKHTTYKLGYHFVWCPKYRKAILSGSVAADAEAELRRLAQSNGWTIHSLAIQPDHVHLFLLPRPLWPLL